MGVYLAFDTALVALLATVFALCTHAPPASTYRVVATNKDPEGTSFNDGTQLLAARDDVP